MGRRRAQVFPHEAAHEQHARMPTHSLCPRTQDMPRPGGEKSALDDCKVDCRHMQPAPQAQPCSITASQNPSGILRHGPCGHGETIVTCQKVHEGGLSSPIGSHDCDARAHVDAVVQALQQRATKSACSSHSTMLAGMTEASILQLDTVSGICQCQIISCAMSGSSLVASAHACQVLSG